MSKFSIHKNEKILLFCFYSLGILIFTVCNLHANTIQHTQFEQLKKAFLSGHLYLSNNYNSWIDASYYKGHVYWPEGFFPAFLLMPFSFVKPLFQQSFAQLILNLMNLFLLYKISLIITKNKLTSSWLSFAYVFSTAYLAVGMYANAWWFAQVIATSALLLALHEFLYRKRWWLIGTFLAFALTTRADLAIAAVFFSIIILFTKQDYRQKIKQFLIFAFPVLIGFSTILIYNFGRFGSIFEFGYKYHIPGFADVYTFTWIKQYGVWNMIYFPANLYYLFIKSPSLVFFKNTKYLIFPFINTDWKGMSILFTSPILLWCFKARLKDKFVKPALITTVLLLFIILGYFGIGTSQYGYRYALDFSPFLFIILCSVFKYGMSNFAKGLIVVSFFFNLYMVFTLNGVF